MQKLRLDKDKALAFVVGLVYGYRNIPMELKTFSIEDFSEENHRGDKIYYINRKEGKLYDTLMEDVSHICVLREDINNKKVIMFIYKKVK